MASVFEQLTSPLESIRVSREKTFDRLRSLTSNDGKRLDLARPVAGVELPLADIELRLIAIGDLVGQIAKEGDAGLTPIGHLTQLRTALEQLAAGIEAANPTLDQFPSHGGLATVPDDQNVLTGADGQPAWNFSKWAKAVLNLTDTALSHYFSLLASRQEPTAASYEAALSEIRRLLERQRLEYDELTKLVTATKSELASIRTARDTLEKTASDASTHRSEAEKSRKTIAEYEAEATQKVTSIRDVTSQAEKLAASVQTYQPQFEQFQQKLDERDKQFATGKSELDNLIARLTEKEKEIERLNRQAEDMLKGATVAGLASSFGELRDKLSSEVTWARWGFYASLAILGVSAIPLAVYVLPGLSLGNLFGSAPNVTEFELGQLAVRVLLLIPGAWLAKFAAARHAALFRLREHYAYKYSIATSVEGFKKQAPSFQEGIAAAAFHELTFNPADRMESAGQETRHPNPIMDWFLKKIGATADGKTS